MKLNLEDCRIKVNLLSMHTLGSIPHHTKKYFFKNATGLEKSNQNKELDNNPQRGFIEGGNNHLEALRVIRGSKGNNSLFPQLSTALPQLQEVLL